MPRRWSEENDAHDLGIGTGFDCSDWDSDDGGVTGSGGSVNAIDQWCESFTTDPCSQSQSLYCLSNVPSAVRLFFDGFDSTDTGAWSTAVP